MRATTEEQEDAATGQPVSDMSVETIRRRATGGLVSLAARRAFHQAVSFAGNIMLSRLLSPSVFGLFAIITYIVNFFGFFGDIGLGAALVQRKEPPSERVLRTAFAVQQALMMIFVTAVFVAAPFISKKYGFSPASAWLFRALSLSLLLTSMKIIPAILLERRLDFRRIVIPEMCEVIVYQSVAVSMAYLGYGVWSLVCATLARGALGFTVLFVLSPWKMGYAMDTKTAKELIGFGAPFQAGQFFWLLKNAATPVFAGWFCGQAAVGYLTWAWGLALLPYAVIEIVSRIVFPVCSRLRHDKELLGRSIEKFVRMAALGVFPIAMVMIAVAPHAIQYVYNPKWQPDKWQPALPSLYLFLLSMLGAPIINVYSRCFYAVGKTSVAVKLTAVYVFLGWLFNVPLLLKFGFVGIAWSTLLVAVISIWLPMREMKKIALVRAGSQVWAPLVSSVVAMIVTRFIADHFVSGVAALVFVTLLGIVIYGLTMIALQGSRLAKEARSFLAMVGRPTETTVEPVEGV